MERAFGIVVAIVAWASLILQFYLTVTGKGEATPGYDPTVGARIGNFFSYFTILSNILVALLATLTTLAPGSALGRFFARPTVAASVTLNIAVTGIIYFVILRHLYNPQGASAVANAGLHYLQPPLFFVYWLTVLRKGVLRLADVPSVLIFPLIYGAYSLIRGPFAEWYPYPFISVIELGYGRVFLNMVGMLIFFTILGALLVFIDRGLARRRLQSA